MSLADDIFKEQQAIGLKRIPLKAWGKDVFAWELNQADRDDYEASRFDTSKPKKPKINFKGSKARLVTLALRVSGDEGADLVFQPSDVARLQKLGGLELDRVFTECAKLSGILTGDEEDEENPAAKNLTAPTGSSPSASPAS